MHLPKQYTLEINRKNNIRNKNILRNRSLYRSIKSHESKELDYANNPRYASFLMRFKYVYINPIWIFQTAAVVTAHFSSENLQKNWAKVKFVKLWCIDWPRFIEKTKRSFWLFDDEAISMWRYEGIRDNNACLGQYSQM